MNLSSWSFTSGDYPGIDAVNHQAGGWDVRTLVLLGQFRDALLTLTPKQKENIAELLAPYLTP